MQRRALLRRSAALLAAGALTGCLADGSAGPGSDPGTTRATTPTTTEPTRTTTGQPRAEEPFETVAVGSRERVLDPDGNEPHAVTVTNAASAERAMTVRVRRSGENPLLRSWEWTFPAGGRVRVDLLTPATYDVAVFAGGERAGSLEVPREQFDCNSSATRATVTADGDLEVQTVSTAMGCPATVVDHSVRVVDRGCATDGDADSAAVSFDGRTVKLDGTLRAPTPGYGVAVTGFERDEVDGERTAIFTVATTEPDDEDGAGVQCTGALDYEASVTFSEGTVADSPFPGRVVVRHRRDGETVEAGSGSR